MKTIIIMISRAIIIITLITKVELGLLSPKIEEKFFYQTSLSISSVKWVSEWVMLYS